MFLVLGKAAARVLRKKMFLKRKKEFTVNQDLLPTTLENRKRNG